MELENNFTGKPVDEELNARLNNLPSEIQLIISSFSSVFLEGDVHKEYLEDPQKVDILKGKLRKFGLDENALDVAMRIFGFESQDETKPSDSI